MLSGSSMAEDTQRQGRAPREYEKQLIKLESDVRTHIRVEQQLKLHIEGMQQQYDDTLLKHT